MKVISVLLFRVPVEDGSGSSDPSHTVLLTSVTDLTSFNFFIRNTVKEHIVFHSRLVCARTPVGTRQSLTFEQDLGKCHSYTTSCGLAAAVLADAEYPPRVAFVLINRALDAFREAHAAETWLNLEKDPSPLLAFPQGEELLKKFQNPAEADDFIRIQNDLNEVQSVMMVTMEQLLQRGEQLDTLMARTSDLSSASERFYRQAKQNNQCCKWY